MRRIHLAGRVRMTANALVAAGHTGLASVRSCTATRQDPGARTARTGRDRTLGRAARRRRDPGSSSRQGAARIQAGPNEAGRRRRVLLRKLESGDRSGRTGLHEIRRSNVPWSRARVIDALRTAARSNRQGVGTDGAAPAAVWLAARRMFGSVRAALDAARIEPEQVLRRTRLDNANGAAGQNVATLLGSAC